MVIPLFKNKDTLQGRIQDFKLGGAHLKKLRRVEGGAKIFGVFRVKNHDFTPKNHIFSNFRGGGGRRVRPLDPPLLCNLCNIGLENKVIIIIIIIATYDVITFVDV